MSDRWVAVELPYFFAEAVALRASLRSSPAPDEDLKSASKDDA